MAKHNPAVRQARVAIAILFVVLAAPPLAAAGDALEALQDDDGPCYYINLWCVPIPCVAVSQQPLQDCL